MIEPAVTHQNNVFVLNSTITKFSNLLTEIEVWRATGFDAMELHAHKLEHFLSSGFVSDTSFNISTNKNQA